MGAQNQKLHRNAPATGFTIVELLIVIVVIAILAAITIVSYNGVTNRAKQSARASELNSWKKKAEVFKLQNSIECPENYAFICPNPVLGTSAFCVMKFEAKNVGGIATSQPAGSPWVNISQPDALAAATASGGRLLSDAEWMAIAADVLSVKYNWSGGDVGSGIVYQGHMTNNPGSALASTADDNDNLNGITGGIGSSPGSNSSRVFYLSSGDTIWDISGNVFEWVNLTQPLSNIGISGDSGYAWREWNNSSLSFGNLPATSRASTLASYTNPVTGVSLADIVSWNASKGLGRLYANYTDTGTRGAIRGGFWNNGMNGGLLTLSLNNAPSTTNGLIGFRVAR